jgi:hypothetical protein
VQTTTRGNHGPPKPRPTMSSLPAIEFRTSEVSSVQESLIFDDAHGSKHLIPGLEAYAVSARRRRVERDDASGSRRLRAMEELTGESLIQATFLPRLREP